MEILSTAGRGAGRGSAGRDPGVLAVGEEAALIVTSHLPGKWGRVRRVGDRQLAQNFNDAFASRFLFPPELCPCE